MKKYSKNDSTTLLLSKNLKLCLALLLLFFIAISCTKEVNPDEDKNDEKVCKLMRIESPESTISFVYNSKGYIQSHTKKSIYDDNSTFVGSYIFNYDAANKIINGSYFNDFDGKKNTTNFTLEYNGDLISHMNLGGHSFLNISYNDKKQPTKVEFKNTCCSDVVTTLLEYDGVGNLIKETTTNNMDSNYDEKLFSYEEHKNPISMVSKLLPFDFTNNTPFFKLVPVKIKYKSYYDNEISEFELIRTNILKDQNGFVISSDLSIRWNNDPIELIGNEKTTIECN